METVLPQKRAKLSPRSSHPLVDADGKLLGGREDNILYIEITFIVYILDGTGR